MKVTEGDDTFCKQTMALLPPYFAVVSVQNVDDIGGSFYINVDFDPESVMEQHLCQVASVCSPIKTGRR